jgi:hypothetical protein
MVKKNENGVYYCENDLKKLLDAYENFDMKIFLNNEIFRDLVCCNEFRNKKSAIKGKNGQVNYYSKEANANHIAFAFSFVYLASFLYRYARHSVSIDDEFIDEKTMYMICNTSPDNRGKKGMKYITKKGGLLENIGYVRRVLDYPITYIYLDKFDCVVDYKKDKIDSIHFVMSNELEDDLPCFSSKREIFYPIKAFYLSEEDEEEGYLTGYFYEIENTTMIPISVFIYCMAKKDLGPLGFYVYCFLKYKCDYFYSITRVKGYTVSIDKLSNEIGVGRTKLLEMLKTLEEYNMISNSHNIYVLGLPQDKKVPPNTYTIKGTVDFRKSTKKTVHPRRVMKYDDYNRIYGRYLMSDEDKLKLDAEVKDSLSLLKNNK